MLLLDKTLLKMTKGLWIWIVSLVVIRVCSLVMITNFASSISYFLGNMTSLRVPLPGQSLVPI